MKRIEPWIGIANCESIPLREGRVVEIGGREIAVFNLGGRFLAVDNRCPHKAGPLADGIVSANTVVCPLHAWKFDLETGSGANASSSASCVTTYPIRIEHGVLWLQLSADESAKNNSPDTWAKHTEQTCWDAPSSK